MKFSSRQEWNDRKEEAEKLRGKVDPALFLSCSQGEKGLRQGHFKSVTGASEITRAAFVDNDSDSEAETEECDIEDWEKHLYDDSEIKV